MVHNSTTIVSLSVAAKFLSVQGFASIDSVWTLEGCKPSAHSSDRPNMRTSRQCRQTSGMAKSLNSLLVLSAAFQRRVCVHVFVRLRLVSLSVNVGKKKQKTKVSLPVDLSVSNREDTKNPLSLEENGYLNSATGDGAWSLWRCSGRCSWQPSNNLSSAGFSAFLIVALIGQVCTNTHAGPGEREWGLASSRMKRQLDQFNGWG